jgi:hypothetical protein
MYKLDEINPIRKLFGLPPTQPRASEPAPANPARFLTEDFVLQTGEDQGTEEEEGGGVVSLSSGPKDKKLEKELAALGIFVEIRYTVR